MASRRDAVVRAHEPTVLDLTLGRPGRIEGTVIDPIQDAALEGVEIRLLGPDGAEVERTTTDEAGSYGFGPLRPGAYAVEALAPIGYVASVGPHPVQVDPNGTSAADLELRPGGIVRGRVVDEHSGEPLDGVAVELLDSQGRSLRQATTTEGGAYEFVNLPEDRYTVRVGGAAAEEL